MGHRDHVQDEGGRKGKGRRWSHGAVRSKQRCERQLKHYKWAVMNRQGCKVALREDGKQIWYEFREPSGRFVYGLWNWPKKRFVTFLTQEMWVSRLEMEHGDRRAYHPVLRDSAEQKVVAAIRAVERETPADADDRERLRDVRARLVAVRDVLSGRGVRDVEL